MLQTLFYIPDTLFGLPLFGFGLLLAVWAVASVVILAWQLSRHGVNEETLGFVPLLALIGAAILWLLPALLEHRPSGEVRGLPIRGYGVMLLLGVVAAVALAVRLAKKRGFDPEMIYSLALWLLGGGIIGARLFYVIEYWDVQFLQHTEDGGVNIWGTLAAVANVAQGGLVVYGSFVGGAISTIWFLRRNRLPVLQMCDLVAPGVMLGLAIGRIGCFLNGCCFGGVSDVPWAVEFPISSPPAKRQMNRAELYLHGLAFKDQSDVPGGPAIISAVQPGSPADKAGLKPDDRIVSIYRQSPTDATPEQLFPTERIQRTEKTPAVYDESKNAAEMALLGISGEGTKIFIQTENQAKPVTWTVTSADEPPVCSRPIQPTQLYGTIDALLLCFVLLAYEPFRRYDGATIALMTTLHPIARFLLESIRTDEPKVYWGLSISQVGSLMFLVVAALLWWYILLRRPTNRHSASRAAPQVVPA